MARVLVVEDNELNLKLFCDLLRVHGHEPLPERDGRAALQQARSFGPALIVMDIQLPYVSGLELIDQLKGDAALASIPIMAVTAYAGKGDEERIRAAGAESYVSKPISVMRFLEAIEGLLAIARSPVVEPQEDVAEADEAPVETVGDEALLDDETSVDGDAPVDDDSGPSEERDAPAPDPIT